MKANEFVKKFGIEHTKWILVDADLDFIDVHSSVDGACHVAVSDLKRLVDSWELVEKYKKTYGESAKWFFIAEYCKNHRLAPHQSDVYDFVAAKYDSCVADVESCQ